MLKSVSGEINLSNIKLTLKNSTTLSFIFIHFLSTAIFEPEMLAIFCVVSTQLGIA